MTVADALAMIDRWPVPSAAAGSVDAAGNRHRHGPSDRVYPLASVTKPLFAYAVLIAVEEGSIELDGPTQLSGVTIRHLLSHSGGVDPDQRTLVSPPGTRRIYSNAGFEMLGEVLADATGFSPADYLREAVVDPLGMVSTTLAGSPAHGAVSTVDDLTVFAAELLSPALIDPATLALATSPVFGELSGVLPGFGPRDPNPWGLGFEIRGQKSPHWTGSANSPATFGHFGRAGTMLWVDPVAQRAAVALTDREFGSWAAQAWPPFSDSILAAENEQ